MTEDEIRAWDEVTKVMERGWNFTLSYGGHNAAGWLCRFSSWPMTFDGKHATVHYVGRTRAEAMHNAMNQVLIVESVAVRDTSFIEHERQADAAEETVRDADAP